MNRRATRMSLSVLLLTVLAAASGCTFELFCYDVHVTPKPIKVAAAPAPTTTPQTAQPRSFVETVKAFLTLYPCLQDVLAAIKANEAIPVPVEYHKRFILLRVGK